MELTPYQKRLVMLCYQARMDDAIEEMNARETAARPCSICGQSPCESPNGCKSEARMENS